MPLLSQEEVQEALAGLPGWRQAGNALHWEREFTSFREAMAFVARVAEDAEARDHHPDIDIRYRRVFLRLSTHSEGGITRRDLDAAAVISKLAGTQ